MDLPGRTIKAGALRTVVELGATDAPSPRPGEIWKVFHARGASALRDGLRARAEARAATALASAGVPTPALLGVRRIAGRPAVGFARVEGAVSLTEALAAPRDRRATARAVGDLLGAMSRAGVTHPDLHPGNVLLGSDGVARLIDVRGARVERSARAWRRSVATLCGAVRERHPRGAAAAARVLRAHVRDLDLAALADEARASRREACARRVRVWRRDSADTTLGADGVVRVRDGAAPAPPGWAVTRVTLGRDGARRAWATLVRAHLHGLPAALPRALHADGVEVAVPPDTREVEAHGDPALDAALADRGLALRGPVLTGGRGRDLVGPSSVLVARAPRGAGSGRRRRA